MVIADGCQTDGQCRRHSDPVVRIRTWRINRMVSRSPRLPQRPSSGRICFLQRVEADSVQFKFHCLKWGNVKVCKSISNHARHDFSSSVLIAQPDCRHLARSCGSIGQNQVLLYVALNTKNMD
ncbi:hypothetical protein F444_21095 [Phytophthora nicotianae P1976]|uniref:Uncharacterized protein n=1 Tax=Phytophthora nicotianae P1976 TaxID=1317066 RepID=A0A080Z298_PHYNI|nr:hypothetical protein F444_21095 [Phytophthora nicotianae P1976]